MARKKTTVEERCDAQVKSGELVCGRGDFCNDPKTWQECANGHRGQRQEQPTEIQPGEFLEIRMGRLESGEWYAQIGGAEDEGALAQTSAFPWEALRGLAKQTKERVGDLVGFRAAGDQEPGLCIHASADGTLCCLLECPSTGAEAVVRMLREARAALLEGAPTPSGLEIVRLPGVMKEPRLVGKGEDEGDVLTATFEVAGEDLTPEFRYLRPSAKKQVVAIVYHAYAAPRAAARADQLDMFAQTHREGGDTSMTCCPEETEQAEETKPDEVPAETQSEVPATETPEAAPEQAEETPTEGQPESPAAPEAEPVEEAA